MVTKITLWLFRCCATLEGDTREGKGEGGRLGGQGGQGGRLGGQGEKLMTNDQ